MQYIVDRGLDIIEPFQCLFMTSSPVQPPRKPPSALPLEIWLDIFQFATYVPRSSAAKPLDPFAFQRISRDIMGVNTPAMALYTKLALARVSKAWRRLTIPLLYEHIVVRSPSRANMILNVLWRSANRDQESADPPPPEKSGYGQWTRHIEVLTHSRGSANLSYYQTVFSIFRLCQNVRVLTGVWNHIIPAEFASVVSQWYGPCLESLSWCEAPSKTQNGALLSPSSTFTFLGSFKSLRVLDLRHRSIRLRTGVDPYPLELPDGIQATLPLVRHLIVSSHSRSLSIAAHLSLPRLLNLTIKTSLSDKIDNQLVRKFLQTHGELLESVEISLPSSSPDDESAPDSSTRRTASHINPEYFLDANTCPNLLSISFPITSPVPDCETPHPNLRRIGLRGVRSDILLPDGARTEKNQLLVITPERYPMLESVQTIGFLVEADGDSGTKDVFIWWVERFEKFGIDFLDGEGVLWVYDEPEPRSNSVGPNAAVKKQYDNEITVLQ
ncbi:hypothetical protein FA15DRAFT_369306 [Coprinopsis marcescibilis]|uniref:Uncharacterized protein n=1 Tax=Coprinopsis marcescibilis TaxID=230819 RepID=A0A5C3KXK8_COPMA|nr:hypothetical protein FA15DRAFT_369306 [Coprinopsis marcescibilis]